MPQARQHVLRSIMQAVGEGVIVWSLPDGVLSDCNDAAARILGVSRSELAGRTLDYPWLLTGEDGKPLPQDARGAVLAIRTGKSQPTMVLRVGRPDGSWAWVRSSSIVLCDSTGQPYAVVTTFVDITALRRAQEEARDLAGRFADAITGANVGTWELDLASRSAQRNARWAEILGHSLDEIDTTLGAFTERIHPEERDACQAIMSAGFGSGEPFAFECRAKHKSGDWRWVQVRGRLVERGPDGQPKRAAGVLVDIDATKRAEDALRTALTENERHVRALQAALDKVRTLEGLLPICMYCKAIRDGGGAWSSLEAYVTKRTAAHFSHGVCPSCLAKHFPDDQ